MDEHKDTKKDEKPIRKTLIGIVTSDKMNKTRVVRVDSMKRHPLYTKLVRKSVKFKVHDEKNSAKEGDKVKIEESRPISRDKRWRLVEIIPKK